MSTINQIKQSAEADTPLLLFQCTMSSGQTLYWGTHSIFFLGQGYSARVLKHNLFELQLSADDAMDGVSHLSLTLANADSTLSELNSAIGFKGAQMTVWFAFGDLATGMVTTEAMVLFRGISGAPDLITEDSLSLSFTNKLSLQRIPVPEVRIQRTCPWNFPANNDERAEALSGGTLGKFSRVVRCGYSADVAGGVGNLADGGLAYTTCDKSRGQCTQRGMFDRDSRGNVTRRFGGFEYVPSAINVRTAGDKSSHLSPLLDNAAKFNDPVPLVYGTGWMKAPAIFARNDGNLTHVEVLLGMGPIQGVLKTVVNDVEIPLRADGKDMTNSGWYSLITSGGRQGNFDIDFVDGSGNPLGDPYGNLAVLSIVVPNQICSGRSLPNVEILLQGQQLDTYTADGSFGSNSFTNNPAWIILDLLRRCGWSVDELNLSSFARSAAFCEALIATTDLNGNAIQVPRYECNLLLTKRQSAATVIRGIRVASSLMLRYGLTGLLELVPETSIAAQQALLPDGSNSRELLDEGWPAYEFSDGSAAFSGIARNPDGSSSVRLSSRSVGETSNRLSVEFQDSTSEYQQDSLSLVDSNDSALVGYEISAQSTAIGIANFSQATRVLLRQLDKATKGNLFIEFVTSFRALKIRPGDIIAFTYLKEGLSRVPFRVLRLAPGLNYQAVSILAQIHDDDWYSDNPAVLMNAGRQPGTVIRIPQPLIGVVAHNDPAGEFEYFDFGVSERMQALKDGSAIDTLTVSFAQPTSPTTKLSNIPLVSLSPKLSDSGGSIPAGVNLYYAVTGVDEDGRESAPSFTVPVSITPGLDTNSVTIGSFSFPRGATQFHVYRGSTPQELYRITQAAMPLADQFTDIGFPAMNVGPPDASFEHANFYYRYEYAGPFLSGSFSPTSIGCDTMGAEGISYGGFIVRIIEGRGRGQERVISSNTASTVNVCSAWSTVPDQTSQFVIVGDSWKFAAVTSTSPAMFEIPFESGATIQILGRAANVNNQECSAVLSPVTRRTLGTGQPDAGLAGLPNFALAAPGAGALTLSGVSFATLANTSSISSGTIQLFAWNELSPTGTFMITEGVDLSSTQLSFNQPTSFLVGDVLQIGSELITVLTPPDASGPYTVARGSLASQVGAHQTGDLALFLTRATLVVPFAQGFFDNRASQNFTYTTSLPDYRVCAAQVYVTNSFGDSPSNQICYISATQAGLRTLSGGQLSLQVGGFIATQQNAAPEIIVEASHAVRDIRATLTQASAGYDVAVDLLQNGIPYCSLEIRAGAKTSASILDGLLLPPLQENAKLTMDVAVNAIQGYSGQASPGMDLTVTIRR